MTKYVKLFHRLLVHCVFIWLEQHLMEEQVFSFQVRAPSSRRHSARSARKIQQARVEPEPTQGGLQKVQQDYYLAPPPKWTPPTKKELEEKWKDSPYHTEPFYFEEFRKKMNTGRSVSAKSNPKDPRRVTVTKRKPRRYKGVQEHDFTYTERCEVLNSNEKKFFRSLREKYLDKYSSVPYHNLQFANREASIIKAIERDAQRRTEDQKQRRKELKEHEEALRKAHELDIDRRGQIFCKMDPSLRIIPSTERRIYEAALNKIYI